MKECSQKIKTRSKVIFSYYKHEIELKGVLYLKSLPIYAIVIGYIDLLAYLTKKPIETTFQVCAFLFLRYKFNKTYHAKNTVLCLLMTLGFVTFAILSTPRFGYSLFGCICTAFVVCFISYILKVLADLRKPKMFNITTCTRSEFIARCREVNLTKNCTEIALAYFYDKSMSLWDIAREYSIDYDSVRRKVSRIKHKLTDYRSADDAD